MGWYLVTFTAGSVEEQQHEMFFLSNTTRRYYGGACMISSPRKCMFVMQVFEEILGSRLTGVSNIRGVYDWKSFLRGVRPRTADKDIQLQYSLQFKATEDASAILVRSKDAVDLNVAFGPWNQILPNPQRPNAIPRCGDIPPVCEPKDWFEFNEEIVPSLTKFYNEEFQHPVHIPVAEKEEMLQFLTHGPDPHDPPAWLGWDDVEVETQEVPPDAPLVAAAAENRRRRQPLWRPFLQPRRQRTCACGSHTHQRTTHRDCPMNRSRVPIANHPRRVQPPATNPSPHAAAQTTPPPPDVEAPTNNVSPHVKLPAHQPPNATTNSPSNCVSTSATTQQFPFAVGTWVAFEFDSGLYAGQITQVYHEDNECKVVFTDGDTADYDADEIHYAQQLYQRHFA